MKSLIRSPFTNQDATSAAQSDVFSPQRLVAENGAWQIQFSKDPGGSASGTLKLMGRMTPAMGWAEIDSVNISAFTGISAYPHAVISADVDIVPQLRVEIVSPSSVAAATKVTVRGME